jgi:hypothetical protein
VGDFYLKHNAPTTSHRSGGLILTRGICWFFIFTRRLSCRSSLSRSMCLAASLFPNFFRCKRLPASFPLRLFSPEKGHNHLNVLHAFPDRCKCRSVETLKLSSFVRNTFAAKGHKLYTVYPIKFKALVAPDSFCIAQYHYICASFDKKCDFRNIIRSWSSPFYIHT